MAASNGGASTDLRDAFAAALVELGRERGDVVVLDADLNTSSKTNQFMDAFPERFIQVGIAEQDLFGIAAGLALEGFVPFPSTFAAFAARRALDQIAIAQVIEAAAGRREAVVPDRRARFRDERARRKPVLRRFLFQASFRGVRRTAKVEKL